MAVIKLADVIDIEVFLDLPPVNSPEKSAIYASGIVARNAELDEIANSASNTGELPFWNDLDANDEPNISTDDETVHSVPKKTNQGKQTARQANLNQSWSAMDLTRDMTLGADPMAHVQSRTETYWTRQWQRRLVASAVGVMLDNVANGASDMVHDISIEDGNAATAVNMYSRTAFVQAAFTLGDQFESVRSIAVHSTIYARMVENDDIDFIPDSQGNLTIPTYMGKTVILDDGTPTIAGTTSGLRYISILFGDGAFGWGEGSAITPMEIDRAPSAGNGGGQETLFQRKKWILHPAGYQFTSTTVASLSATLAELRNPANWTRVVVRKNVSLAFLITNG